MTVSPLPPLSRGDTVRVALITEARARRTHKHSKGYKKQWSTELYTVSNSQEPYRLLDSDSDKVRTERSYSISHLIRCSESLADALHATTVRSCRR